MSRYNPAIDDEKDRDGDRSVFDADSWCAGFVRGWNAQAEIKERTCRDLNQEGYNHLHCSVCDMKIYRADQQFNYCPSCGAKVVTE